MIGTIKIITVEFTEDQVFEGSIPRECYDNAREDLFEVDDIDEAVRVFTDRGLSFKATGTEWAESPDGSAIVNYATGGREEVSGHFAPGFDADAVTAIIERVG